MCVWKWTNGSCNIPWEKIWAEIQTHSGSNVYIVNIYAHTHSHNKTVLNKLNEPCTFTHTTTFCLNHKALNHTYTLILLTGALDAHTHTHFLQTGSGSGITELPTHSALHNSAQHQNQWQHQNDIYWISMFALIWPSEHNKHGCVLNMKL